MAIYDPIVPRPKDGADLPDSLQRALYQQMLSEELGRRPEGFVPAEPTREWRDLIVPVAGMIFLAALVLAGMFLFRKWQDGDILWRLPDRIVTQAERQWRYEDRARPAEEPAAPMVSEIDRMIDDQRKPPPEVEAAPEAAATEE